MRTMEIQITLETLGRAIAPPRPVPPNTVGRWLELFGMGGRRKGDDRRVSRDRVILTPEEIAALTAYAWLRMGTGGIVPMEEAQRISEHALKLLRQGEQTVLVILTLSREGAKLEARTTPVDPPPAVPMPGDPMVYAFDVALHVARIKSLVNQGVLELAR